MGREGEWLEQPVTQPIDVAQWKGDDEFEVYPEGARDKSLLISPRQSEYDFLIPNHRYLFKHPFRRHPDQFWTEIIAYRIGCMLEIPVPPAFVAYDSDNGMCGALIEWFVDYPDAPEERFVPGGDIMASEIYEFDRKKGRQHNFLSIEKYLSALDRRGCRVLDWLGFWCDMLLFDALIGNTDRHQDNWGLLWTQGYNHVRMAPAFDNGTSLGYEILDTKMANFDNPGRMQAYLDKGRHHLRWRLDDSNQGQHFALLESLLLKHPSLKNRMQKKLMLFQWERLQAIMSRCIQYPITVPLSTTRADFVCKLVGARYRAIVEKIKSLP
ncbi:MAG: HipA domain-containing protein [Methylomicrobium sp.]|nr:HipA domain-containing protein [Methylomicrobium sp.]